MRLPLTGLLLTSLASAQQLVHDDFDRPDSTNLGPDWVEANNDLELFGGAARGKFAFLNDTWMHHASFSQGYPTAKAVVDFASTPGDVFFGTGVVLGLDPNTWGGVAVRVTDNDLDGSFDRVFFEAAINAGAWFSQPTPVWYDLPSGLPNGQLTAWVDAASDTVWARVEDGAGQLVGLYSAAGIAASPFAPSGDKVGVWVSSRSKADNFFAMEHQRLDAFPAAVSMASGGTQVLDVDFGAAHAGELYLVLASATGTAPSTPTGSGPDLPLVFDSFTLWTFQHPNQAPYTKTFGQLGASGSARARVTVPPNFDPGLVGVTFHHAALTVNLQGVVTAVSNPAPLLLLP